MRYRRRGAIPAAISRMLKEMPCMFQTYKVVGCALVFSIIKFGTVHVSFVVFFAIGIENLVNLWYNKLSY